MLNPLSPAGAQPSGVPTTSPGADQPDASGNRLREAFDQFVGQTFYGQLLAAMRKTTHPPAYFDGGRAEQAFRAQLDQTLAEKMAEATADQFTGPMFTLFTLQRS